MSIESMVIVLVPASQVAQGYAASVGSGEIANVSVYLHEPWLNALTVLVTGEDDPVTENDTSDIAEAGTVNARASQGEPTVIVMVVSTLAS